MFVVGKKYKHHATGTVRECVWVNATHAALFSAEHPSFSAMAPHDSVVLNPEHVEPLKGYVLVWKRDDGSLYLGTHVYTDCEAAGLHRHANDTRIVDIAEVVYNGKE